MKLVTGTPIKNLKLKYRIIEKFGYQSDFARLCGIPEYNLSREIHGRGEFTEDIRRRICKKLDVPYEEIYPTTKDKP